MLTFFVPGATPDLGALHNGAQFNPHGHGYALITGDTITTGHSLDQETAIGEFAALRIEYPHGPALFHSRFATHGVHDLDNCHPFPVGGDPRTILAHNGVLPAEVHPADNDPRSDTRIAAEDFLPTNPFGSLDSWAGREGLETWLRTDKLVVLTVDPAYRSHAYLFNEGRGHWDTGTGIWYSNSDYLDHDWLYQPDLGFRSCEFCGAADDEIVGPHCRLCGFCAECHNSFPHCDCAVLDGHDRYGDLIDREYA
ncbi:hypothetical protein [Nocardia sp. CNY236]|uniref:hypothetical protein n=1 Tax=Nocardia sp. CNY236 TaxID=1169152 RepID=UPI0003F8E60D|nr:hypothetical protein [Nocardia sp. CNY236]